jgi:hypothetical protein
MGRARYVKHPGAIIQKRRTKNSKRDTLTVTIPRRAVDRTGWQAGDIIEFVPVIEGSESYVKIRKVQQ